jgi:transcriptional regulator with XRE-family HTH domain
MNFGDKIKLLRNEQELTQPELADKIGIEQSYLSKIETGKSFPSADNFSLILQAFNLDTKTLLEGIDPTQVFKQLRQIPEVSHYLDKYHKQQKSQRTKLLVFSALFFTIGVTAVVAGRLGLIFPETFYNYYSQGIVLEGEPKEVFTRWSQSIPDTFHSTPEGRIKKDLLRIEIEKRRNEEFLTINEYKGNAYNVSVTGGSRTYYLRDDVKSERTENRMLLLFGLLLSLLGLSGLILEKKFFR